MLLRVLDDLPAQLAARLGRRHAPILEEAADRSPAIRCETGGDALVTVPGTISHDSARRRASPRGRALSRLRRGTAWHQFRAGLVVARSWTWGAGSSPSASCWSRSRRRRRRPSSTARRTGSVAAEGWPHADTLDALGMVAQHGSEAVADPRERRRRRGRRHARAARREPRRRDRLRARRAGARSRARVRVRAGARAGAARAAGGAPASSRARCSPTTWRRGERSSAPASASSGSRTA